MNPQLVKGPGVSVSHVLVFKGIFRGQKQEDNWAAVQEEGYEDRVVTGQFAQGLEGWAMTQVRWATEALHKEA